MLGWLLVNLFFFAVVLIGVGAMFFTFWVVRAAQFSAENEPLAFIVAALVALIATGYCTKWLHGFIQKRI
ncbi:MAG: hypothetical protein U1F35_05460 [Steroidobacteraceae bacterium]